MARSTPDQLILLKNIYTLWAQPRRLLRLTYIVPVPLKLEFPFVKGSGFIIKCIKNLI